MSQIPILSVDHGTLNERERGLDGLSHAGPGPVTRGLCLTETEGGGIVMPRLVWTDRGLVATEGAR